MAMGFSGFFRSDYLAMRGVFWIILCFLLVMAFLPAAGLAQQNDVAATQPYQTGENSCGCATCCCNARNEPQCPGGYTLYDDYCLPDCPSGYVRYPGYPGLCTPPCHHGCPEGYEPVPLPWCPDGYHRDLRDPDSCLADNPGFVPDNCPQGLRYSLETGKCSPECPEGTYLAEDGLCHSAYERVCPEGYQRNPLTGLCVPPGDWPADYRWICLPTCPQGFIRDIYHPTRCTPPSDDCPQGYENVRGLCLPVCEQGAARNSYGYCVPPRCEDGSYPDLRGLCHKPECPEGFDNIRGQCYPPCAQGYRHNLRQPWKCEQGPGEEPSCPDGTALSEQTGSCERIPPPPVKCKQGLDYNPRTKKCEPPPRRVTECPQGFTKTKSGRCVRAEPTCDQGEFFNNNTGQCEPLILKLPRACPEGTVFNRKRQRCLPVFNEPTLENEPDSNVQTPGFKLNRNILKLPELQQQCPAGTAADKNGRCVPVQ